jgi:putative FmdB family regulatory protein
MPTYEYQCDACGAEFELFQSITAKPIKKCPECGKLRVRRLIGAGAGIIFKGSGFYQTDYRSDSYHKDAKKEKSTPKPAKDSAKDKSTSPKANEKKNS